MSQGTEDSEKNLYTGINSESEMQIVTTAQEERHLFDWRMVVGVSLVLAGIMLFSEQALHTGVLSILAPTVSGLVLVAAGLRDKRKGYLIAGAIICGTGFGLLAAWFAAGGQSLLSRVGIGIFGLSFGFGLISLLARVVLRKAVWWPLIPCVMLAALAMVFSFTGGDFLDYVLFLGGGLGFVFLMIGMYKKILGFVIPGGLLLGIAPGVAFSWGHMQGARALAQTGTMLVWFAFGWAIITLIARLIFQKFIWWPLIPGGILAVVGWGLYIGGNPGNAINFIGNTGSIVMIIFGIYLLLMRRGIRH